MIAAPYGELLDSLRGVAWPSRRAALAGTAGSHVSRLRGLSAEFTEYRPYRQGDDPRRLDWKLLARTDRAFVRITSDRATLGTVLVVDASASMAWPEDTRAKWVQACRLAVGLAAVAHSAGDPVGLAVAAGGGAARLGQRTRRGVLAEIVRALEFTAPSGEAPLAPLVRSLRGTPRVALIGDLLGDEIELRRSARELLAGGTEVHVVHVVAREELDPPGGTFLAVDPERPQVWRAFAETSRGAYLDAFGTWRTATARAWRKAGAAFTAVVSDEQPARAVRRVCGLIAASAG